MLPRLSLAQSKEPITLTAGLSKPPFVIEDDNQKIGIQLELIKAAFSTEQRDVSFLHLPLSRSFSSIEKWHSDGTITLPLNYKREGVYLSLPYISYHNVLVTLAEDKIELTNINDVAEKKVVAFQTAQHFLGDEFESAVQGAQDYREMADQAKQIEMLFMKRAEILVLDISIFKYFLLQHSDKKYKKPYVVHSFFKPANYSAGFKNKLIRDEFNRGLNTIKMNGTYQKILDKYQR